MVWNVEVVPVVGNQVSCGAKPGVGDVSLGCSICTSKLRTGSLRVSLFPCRLFCRGGFKSVAYRLSGRVCQFLFLEVSLSGSQMNLRRTLGSTRRLRPRRSGHPRTIACG